MSDLPTGVLRSTMLPLDILGGTRLFLEYDGRWYLVRTRFQTLKRCKKLCTATALYEGILDGTVHP